MLTETWLMGPLVGALGALAPANDAGAPKAVPNPLAAPICPGVALVISTEASEPERSLATLVTRDAVAHLRVPGDEVAGMQLVFVGYNGARMSPAAWLATPTSLCQALLFEPPTALPRGAGTPPVRAPNATSEPRPRGALRPSRLRVVPVRRAGSVVGVRLLGIAPSGLLATLGLENGDILESLNGFELGTPEKALQAYARLRTADRLALKIVRRARPMTIDFVIR